ncbi:MAG: hypothetical protein AUG09_01220 [Acidobacteria bacterium 13_1_20CM_2_68_7]|nr:MAG: hypothetical protein AUG09_01220 [Acidobacteria bacterium 13_1_20CM_2_68_7]
MAADPFVDGAPHQVEGADAPAAAPQVAVHLVGARPDQVHVGEGGEERRLDGRHGSLVGHDRQVIDVPPAG